jgi:oligopeptide transport system substrate-binding protein
MRTQLRGIALRVWPAIALGWCCATLAADPNKVLRVAIVDIDTLDPQQTTDTYSTLVQGAIFEGLYEWAYLVRPARLVPNTAASPPEISDGGKTWTIRLRPGIFFSDDPAFGGKRRELVAEDYVYSMKRQLDPNLRVGGDPLTTDAIVGARAAVDAARQPGKKFDYDAPIEGLRALDRYTLQLRLVEPNYELIEGNLVNFAVAREVVDAAKGNIQARAVGTGPYRLKEWLRGTRLVLEANPNYRALSFPESPDPTYADLVRSMRGKQFPQVGLVEINLISEELPTLLEFEREKLDYVQFVTDTALSLLNNGKLRADYAARGIRYHAVPRSATSFVYFNLDDAVLGGMSREHIALRRAVVLGFDTEALVKVVYGGLAAPADQLIPPTVTGHDPGHPGKSLYDPAGARALLDRVGYVKRDADGFRTAPDGRPLTLTMLTRPERDTRDAETLWKKNMEAIGLRLQFRELPIQDLLKESAAGHYQLLHGASCCFAPLGYTILQLLYGKSPPDLNRSRFNLPEYDRAMEEYLRTPTGPAQIAPARTMSQLALNYAPMVPTVVRLLNSFVQPWLLGFYPSDIQVYWKYLDIDLGRRQSAMR